MLRELRDRPHGLTRKVARACTKGRQCGNRFYEEVFGRQLRNYRNLWDPETHFFRARDEEGHWNDGFEGQPWKTQYWVREIMKRLYNSTPDGFPGDEDQGGMSSWYVLSALGLYAVTPGTNEYVLGSPLFRRATITMEDGKQFVIEARDNSTQNVYIQSAELNGQPLQKNYITYDDIVRGGRLVFQMGPQPNRQRGTTKDATPYSLSAR